MARIIVVLLILGAAPLLAEHPAERGYRLLVDKAYLPSTRRLSTRRGTIGPSRYGRRLSGQRLPSAAKWRLHDLA